MENRTKLEINGGKSKTINLERGIYEGAPTSPNVFNAANSVTNNLDNPCIKNEYGYHNIINDNLEGLSVLSFVNDTGIVANSIEAKEMYQIASNDFAQCGLTINPIKSKAIVIENGALVENDIQISENVYIKALKKDETIKYLGVNSQLKF